MITAQEAKEMSDKANEAQAPLIKLRIDKILKEIEELIIVQASKGGNNVFYKSSDLDKIYTHLFEALRAKGYRPSRGRFGGLFVYWK